MNNQEEPKKKKAKKDVNPLLAGLAGGVVVAGTAAAVNHLKDKKNREKLKNAASNLRDQGQRVIGRLGGKIEDTEDKVKDIGEKAKKEIEKD